MMNHNWQFAFVALVALPASTAAATNPTTKKLEPLAREYFIAQPAQPLAASLDEGENPLDFEVFWKDSLNFRTMDKSVSLKIGGRIHFDTTFFSEDLEEKSAGALDFENGSEFRRTRLYLSGKFKKNLDFKIQVDFAADTTGADFKDVYTTLKCDSGVNFRVGQFNEPFSLGELTSSNSAAFLERATPTGIGPVRSTGAMVFGDAADDRMTWALGVFKDEDDVGTATGTGEYAFTSRITSLVVDIDDTIVHLGVAASLRDATDGNFDDGFRPPAHLAPSLINNDAFAADDSLLIGAEVAVSTGPFWASGEYMMNDVDAQDGLADATLSGYYFQAGYFLTGEHRPYKRSKGAFGTLKPLRPKGGTDGGCGAWEVAVRYSMLEFENLRSGGNVFTDELSDATIGVNWYWNPNFRIMFNYVMFDLDAMSTGVDGDGSAAQTRFSLFL